MRKSLLFATYIISSVLVVFMAVQSSQANGDTVKRTLEITYDNKAKQIISLDQPSGNVSSMIFTGLQGATFTPVSQPSALTKGWDDFNQPLSFGQVSWSVLEGQNSNNLEVTYYLSGAMANHEFTVGVHMFNPTNATAKPNISSFGGRAIGGDGVINRDGKTAYAIPFDFGSLRTNANGDGNTQFKLSIPPGNYNLQFTVRIGGMNTCVPSQGAYGGCSIVYRSGNKFGERLENIVIR